MRENMIKGLNTNGGWVEEPNKVKKKRANFSREVS